MNHYELRGVLHVVRRQRLYCWHHATYYISNAYVGCLFCPYTAKAAYTRRHLESLGI